PDGPAGCLLGWAVGVGDLLAGEGGRGPVMGPGAAPDRRRLHVPCAVARLLPQDPAVSRRGRSGVLARDDDRGAAHGGPADRGAGELLPAPGGRIEALREPLAQHAHGSQDAESDRAQATEPALSWASARATSAASTSPRRATRRGDNGRHRDGAVTRKSTTPGVPTAPARWLTPLSLPT